MCVVQTPIKFHYKRQINFFFLSFVTTSWQHNTRTRTFTHTRTHTGVSGWPVCNGVLTQQASVENSSLHSELSTTDSSNTHTHTTTWRQLVWQHLVADTRIHLQRCSQLAGLCCRWTWTQSGLDSGLGPWFCSDTQVWWFWIPALSGTLDSLSVFWFWPVRMWVQTPDRAVMRRIFLVPCALRAVNHQQCRQPDLVFTHLLPVLFSPLIGEIWNANVDPSDALIRFTSIWSSIRLLMSVHIWGGFSHSRYLVSTLALLFAPRDHPPRQNTPLLLETTGIRAA